MKTCQKKWGITNKLTSICKTSIAFFEKPTVAQLTPCFLWNKMFKCCVHKSTTGPYLEPDLSNSYLQTQRSILILFSHIHLSSQCCLFPLGFLMKISKAFLTSPIHTTCPSHLLILDLISPPHPMALIGQSPWLDPTS